MYSQVKSDSDVFSSPECVFLFLSQDFITNSTGDENGLRCSYLYLYVTFCDQVIS